MKWGAMRLLATGLGASALLFAGCGDGDSADREAAEATARDAAGTVQRESREAWAGLRTDVERLIDEVQTRNDPRAKETLLDRCRDLEERLRRAGDTNADRVNEWCDDIRDADVDSRGTWDEIERRFNELDSRLRG